MEYRHQPLADGDIRLLHLDPSPSPQAPLEGTITHVLLDDVASGFEALSYTWGTGWSTEAMTVRATRKVDGNGDRDEETEACSSLRLTPNLSAALRRLRHPDRIRILWIDQICIDQTDSAEKSVQVPLLGHIYTIADRVLVWLGEEDEDTAKAFADLEVTPRDLEDLRKNLAGRGLISPVERPVHMTAEEEDEEDRLLASHWPPPKIAGSMWKASAKLFEREFFQRVWVVQEVVLARHVVVLCGPYASSWDNLAKVTSLHKHIYFVEEKAVDQIIIIDSIRKRFAADKDHEQNHHRRGMSVSDALFNSHFFKATDQRDKIYGVLGLLNMDNVSDLPISYTATVEDVYLDVTAYMIRKTGSLDILSSIISRPNMEEHGLPSWVPDCRSEPVARQRISPSARLDYTATVTPLSSSSNPIHIRIDDGGAILHAPGILLAEIDVVCDALSGWRGRWTPWMRIAQQAAQAHERDDQPGFPLNYHRLICASDDVAVPGSANCEREVGAFDTWCYWVHEHATEEEGGKPPYAGRSDSKYESMEVSTLAETSCAGRRMMLTRDEKRLALGPEDGQTGDAVCWLQGCSVPMLLRPRGDGKWMVIGACYVQGYMAGVAWSQDSIQEFKIA